MTPPFPTRRSSDLPAARGARIAYPPLSRDDRTAADRLGDAVGGRLSGPTDGRLRAAADRAAGRARLWPAAAGARPDRLRLLRADPRPSHHQIGRAHV